MPIQQQQQQDTSKVVYRGWLDTFPLSATATPSENNIPSSSSDAITYADNMQVNCSEGWYEFKCSCGISTDDDEKENLPDILAEYYTAQTPMVYADVIRQFLIHSSGGNLKDVSSGSSFSEMVAATATLYSRMVAGDSCMAILREMLEKKGVYTDGLNTTCSVLVDGPLLPTHAHENMQRPLHYRLCPIPEESYLMKLPLFKAPSTRTVSSTLTSIVYAEVASIQVVDVHTHLFPPSHGSSLCLFGFDELLTYHYLVSEYFMTAPSSISPEKFYCTSKTEQASIIWNALFVERSPISEATRGIITTLERLGLSEAVQARDLDAIRAFEQEHRDRGAEEYCNKVFDLAGVQYAVMTNIPFDPEEAQHWRPERKVSVVMPDFSANAPMRVKSFFSYHLYPLPDFTPVEIFQTLQIGTSCR